MAQQQILIEQIEGVVTEVADPGADDNIPTEQAVREVLGSGPAANPVGSILYLYHTFV